MDFNRILKDHKIIFSVCSYCSINTNFCRLQSCGHTICKSCWFDVLERVFDKGIASPRCPIDDEILPWYKETDFRNNELNEIEAALPPVLSDALKCTTCFENAASPIYKCQEGHIICGFCAEKVTLCDHCNTKLQPSFLTERLARRFGLKRKCPNFEGGCKTMQAAAGVKNHARKCYYRDVVCELKWKHECDQSRHSFQDFPTHLQTIHERVIHEFITAKTEEVSFHLNGDKFAVVRDTEIYKILKKDGKLFLIQFHVDPLFATIWVTVLGNKADAEKYAWHMKISQDMDKKKKMEQSYTMPVLAYHDYPKFDDANKRHDNCISIPAYIINQFGVRKKHAENSDEVWLRLTYAIV